MIIRLMQTLSGAFIILLLSTAFGKAAELDQVCGTQPSVLEPIYPIEGPFEAPTLGHEPLDRAMDNHGIPQMNALLGMQEAFCRGNLTNKDFLNEQSS